MLQLGLLHSVIALLSLWTENFMAIPSNSLERWKLHGNVCKFYFYAYTLDCIYCLSFALPLISSTLVSHMGPLHVKACYAAHFIHGASDRSVWQESSLWNKEYPIISMGTNILIILLFIAVLCHKFQKSK